MSRTAACSLHHALATTKVVMCSLQMARRGLNQCQVQDIPMNPAPFVLMSCAMQGMTQAGILSKALLTNIITDFFSYKANISQVLGHGQAVMHLTTGQIATCLTFEGDKGELQTSMRMQISFTNSQQPTTAVLMLQASGENTNIPHTIVRQPNLTQCNAAGAQTSLQTMR